MGRWPGKFVRAVFGGAYASGSVQEFFELTVNEGYPVYDLRR